MPKSKSSIPVAGRFSDIDCTESWFPPSKKTNLNTTGREYRFYDWFRGVVVENIGFDDQYFRKMTSEEKSSILVCKRTGAKFVSPIIYSTMTCTGVDKSGPFVAECELRGR